jgi:uncharacterized membrane protein YsdA (DUF1294 family)/cold shock CspA family protein
MQKGILTTWKDDRGFGFIESSVGKRRIFLHITAIRESSHRPQVGDVIYFHLERDEGRLRASNAWFETDRPKPAFKSPVASKKAPKYQSSFSPAPALLCIPPMWGAIDFMLRTRNAFPVLAYIAVGIFTFVLYSEDKNRAVSKAWRIPEAQLHLCELFGGWIGALIAQQVFRHKTRKTSYQLVFCSIVVLHLIFWFDWLFLGKNLAKSFM